MTAQYQPVAAKLTDAMVSAAQKTVGMWYPARPWNTTATKDNIRHWCYGVADINPLYVNERYASATRWGTLIAPPTFMATFSDGMAYPYDPKYDLPPDVRISAGGFPGLAEMFGSDEWEFQRVIKRDQRVRAEKAMTALRETKTDFAGRAMLAVWEVRYFGEDNALVATRKTHIFHVERGAAKERAKYGHLTKYRYEQSELKEIDDSYLQEIVRGPQPRYWQDVRVGDSVGHVTKGPLTTTEVGTFCVGWGGPLMLADEIAQMYYRDHPDEVMPDPETNSPDLAMRLHWDDEFAREMGLPAAIDIGTQRVSWFDHLCNNWKGDDAVTRNLSVRLTEPNFIADTTWIRGHVIRKHLDGQTPLVDLELTGTDQRHRVHSLGFATIELPSRDRPSVRQVSSLLGVSDGGNGAARNA